MIQIGTPPATIDTPLEHLMACHRRIEQRLDTLIHAAGHLVKDQDVAFEAIRSSMEFLETSGVLHTQDEEVSLFPRLREKLSASERTFVDTLEKQHEEAEIIYSELKQLARKIEVAGEPTGDSIGRYLDCAKRLRVLYGDHIRAEDEILTALARRSLNEFEISEISSEMRARRANSKAI